MNISNICVNIISYNSFIFHSSNIGISVHLQLQHLYFALLRFASLNDSPTHFKCCHCLHFTHIMWPVERDFLLHLLQIFLSTYFACVSVDLVHVLCSLTLFSCGSSSKIVTLKGKMPVWKE